MTVENEHIVDYRFKLLYFIGIVFVVWGHCKGHTTYLPWPSIILFTFSSGYFYKLTHEQQIGTYLWKQIKRLLLPLYAWNVFYAIVFCGILGSLGFTLSGDPHFTWYSFFITPITNGHQYILNLGGWFVIPLFCVQVLYLLFRKCLFFLANNVWKETGIFIVCVILGLYGFWLCGQDLNAEWRFFVKRILTFIPFYAFGRFYKSVLETYDKLPSWLTLLLILGIYYAYVGKLGYSVRLIFPWGHFSTNAHFYEPMVFEFLVTLFWMRIAQVGASIAKNSRAIMLVANNTYSIMINHLLGIMLIKGILACISKWTTLLPDFDFTAFYQNIWYYYYPASKPLYGLIYVCAGIAIPLLMSWGLNYTKSILQQYNKLTITK